jgi:hypothetical protein
MNKVVYNACYGGFELSLAANEWLEEHGYEDSDPNPEHYECYPEYRYSRIERHNLLLVKCVEELGEAASGSCANLAIAEIYGTVYRIEEYDGLETVVEAYDQEWISI